MVVRPGLDGGSSTGQLTNTLLPVGTGSGVTTTRWLSLSASQCARLGSGPTHMGGRTGPTTEFLLTTLGHSLTQAAVC
ncbi:hypothetical protein LOW57_003266 [Salmonella enterica subsp. enterica serovar Chester]|nr:hypothetical protein [Salmonella enterica subsp. enterica serovar Chester]